MGTFNIQPARPRERAQAFRLALGYLAGDELARRVAHANSLVSLGELDPDGILVARDGKELLGALVCTPLPGAGGLVWPPFVSEGPHRRAVEDGLLAAGCRWLRQRGARLAEALLADRERPLAAALTRNGFTHVTQLMYLQRDLAAETASGIDRSFGCVPFSRADPQLFRDTLLKTYGGTLDCPELNGVRTIDEVIAGHKGQGKVDPESWWLIQSDGAAIGVLILSQVPDMDAWDLSYVGVVPESRRQGWGRLLTQLAIRAARAAEARQLLVAVDARNRPALALYESLGFELQSQRDVYLAIWSPAQQLARS